MNAVSPTVFCDLHRSLHPFILTGPILLLILPLCTVHAAQHAAKIGLPMGLHLNLTEGPASANMDQVASLLVSQTPWWPTGSTQPVGTSHTHSAGKTAMHMRGKSGLREALSKCEISLEEVGHEVEAQIAAFKHLTGSAPVYLDGHQHVHVLPGIAAVVARVAAREGVQLVRIPDEQATHFDGHVGEERATFYRSIISQAADARAVFIDEGLEVPDSFVGLGLLGADCSAQRLLLRLQALLDDAALSATSTAAECKWGGGGVGRHEYVGEYMCHVGKASVEGDAFSKSHDRDLELGVLCLPAVRHWLESKHVCLSSYHELARARRYLHLYKHTHTHTYTRTNTHTHTHTLTHSHTYVHTYTHIYT